MVLIYQGDDETKWMRICQKIGNLRHSYNAIEGCQEIEGGISWNLANMIFAKISHCCNVLHLIRRLVAVAKGWRHDHGDLLAGALPGEAFLPSSDHLGNENVGDDVHDCDHDDD